MNDQHELTARFESARPRLHAMAVRLLGSSADAEDAVQETWLRLRRVRADEIENLDAWLTTVLTRVCLDLLRSARRTRERSWQVEPWQDEVGRDESWLADPAELVAGRGGTAPDPADVVAESDRVGVALLIVLDLLTPPERIAFVLHDVFGQPFGQIGEALGRTPQAARQLASRARRRLRDAAEPANADRRRARRLVDAWLAAVVSGDLRALLHLLDENAVLHADFGARPQVVAGARDIAAQAVLSARLAAHSTRVLIDGMPGVAALRDGRAVSIMAFELDGERIVALHVLADSHRLAELGIARMLAEQP